MRNCFALVLVSAVISCGGNGGGGGGDDTVDPDATEQPPGRGFRIVSPDIEIQPGQEITYCFYFRTPNTEPLAIKKWKSDMTPGSHHMIMFMTPSDTMPPGTVSASDCGFAGGSGTNLPVWTYAAQNPVAEVSLPIDDGTGKPLAQDVPASSAGYFQMHYLNATDAVIKAHVTLDAEALDAGAPYTKTAAFVTYNGSISIPPNATSDLETRSCATPAGVKFWLMSTHSHKQAIKTAVKDGTAEMFASTDWEHPGIVSFMEPATFYTFASNRLTYECTYANPTNRTITSGDSAVTDEMCMASGYYFPANKPLFCLDNAGPF